MAGLGQRGRKRRWTSAEGGQLFYRHAMPLFPDLSGIFQHQLAFFIWVLSPLLPIFHSTPFFLTGWLFNLLYSMRSFS